MSYLKPDDNRLLFLPLGGSGEIGMNLNLYGHRGRWLMVDCGMSFADPGTPGIDLIFPDIGFIDEERDTLAAMVLTHGHEDHIGAVAHLWPRLRCPVYATPFTAALVREKLAEAGLADQVTLHEVTPGQRLDIGPFGVTYIPLAHSIAEGHGLAIETGQGTLFHTGDWKLDETPLIGPACPSAPLKALGDKGVLSLVIDSTNVFNAKTSGSEAGVRDALDRLVGGLTGRVVITTFASNVARLATIGAVAKAHDRHLVLMGRSMHRVLKAARETGYLADFPPLVDEEDAASLPPEKLLIACTGCQGEPRAALARIARDEHRHVHLSPGDTVIFSSKIIPGNETTLGSLFNMLALRDIDVITEKDAPIHVSGHPGREDLERMFAWIRPKTAIPVHGEARHLRRHAQFASELGVAHALAPRNGQIIDIRSDGLEVVDEAPHGRLALDGRRIVPLDHDSLVERRRLMVQGLVIVSLVIADDGALAAEPGLSLHGLPTPHGADTLIDSLIDETEQALDRMDPSGRLSDGRVEEAARIAIRRFCRRDLGKNPVVDVLICRQEDIEF